jgi:hypothetical protein
MIANIALDDALILPHRANPTGLNFRERQEGIGVADGPTASAFGEGRGSEQGTAAQQPAAEKRD